MRTFVYTHHGFSNISYYDVLKPFKGKLRLDNNGTVIENDDLTATGQQWRSVSRFDLYEFLIRDIASAFLCKRLGKFNTFSIAYNEEESIREASGSSITVYQVGLAGAAVQGPQAPQVKISEAYSETGLEDAMLAMVLFYQQALEKYDVCKNSPGCAEDLEKLVIKHSEHIQLPSKDPAETEGSSTTPDINSPAKGGNTTLVSEAPAAESSTVTRNRTSNAIKLFLSESVSDPRFETPEDRRMQAVIRAAAYHDSKPTVDLSKNTEEDYQSTFEEFINYPIV